MNDPFERKIKRVGFVVQALLIFQVLCYVVAVVVFAVWAAVDIGRHGLKQSIERIWKGPAK